jgi:putative resolvase
VYLSEWPRRQRIDPQIATNWFHAGTLRVPAVRVNQKTLLVSAEAVLSAQIETLGLHAQVSSHDHRGDLDPRWPI